MTNRQHPGPPDALVVGAGLAGLACALDLIRAGLRVELLEASDGVGGRMRTDRRDGFLLDRGFQVFNTSYPQVKKRLDLRALRLRPFTPGLVARTSSGRVRLTDPTRRPGDAGALLPGRVLPARDLAALAALTARDVLLPAKRVGRMTDRTAAEALVRAGLSPLAIEDLLRPFLSGVFLEEGLETSARFLHLVWRSMARGTLCLPAHGIGAVPAQLAAGLPEGALRLDSAVTGVTDSGVLLADGGERPGGAVVVATDSATAARLLPGLPVPDGRTVTTYYHAADRTHPGRRQRSRRPEQLRPHRGRPLLRASWHGTRVDLRPGIRPARRGEDRPGAAGRALRRGHERLGDGGRLHRGGRPARDAASVAAEPYDPFRTGQVRLRGPPGHRVRAGRARLRQQGGTRGSRRPRGRADHRDVTGHPQERVDDAVVVGGGAAGLCLAHWLTRTGTGVTLVEAPDGPLRPAERTWCYWEAGTGEFEEAVVASWRRLRVRGPDGAVVESDPAPLRYRMVRSGPFERLVHARLAAAPAARVVRATAHEVSDAPYGAEVRCTAADGRPLVLRGRHVFDSRPVRDTPPHRTLLLQHFRGWFVRTAVPRFDPGVADLMDFRVPQPGHGLAFGYVLPLAADRAF